MSHFSLPLALSSTTHHSKPLSLRRREEISRNRKKRKRNSFSSSDSEHGELEERNVPVALTNPLSLNHNEVIQYKLAGLELNENLPDIVGWPHRGFPPPDGVSPIRTGGRKYKEKVGQIQGGKDVEDPNRRLERGENDKKTKREAQPRHQHISVLTALLHRCLLDGDISRASRAWGLLIRVQVSGRGMDLRSSGYWGIGAELLIRSLNLSHKSTDNFAAEQANERLVQEDDCNMSKKVLHMGFTIEGLHKARDYYERLIVEYPFKRQFPDSVTALDWWPVMIGCEIYGIQFEQNKALQDLEERKLSNEFQSASEEIGDCAGYFEDPQSQEKLTETNRLKCQEYDWQARNQIRQVALTAAESVTARLDERMTIPPYSENCDMLRLRGMLALYVGDLYVPPKPSMEEFEMFEEGLVNGDEEIPNWLSMKRRIKEYKAGLERRAQEVKRTGSLFEKALKEGGDLTDIQRYIGCGKKGDIEE